MLEKIKDIWEDQIVDRIRERTTWDGGVLIALGLVVLFLTPIAKWCAIAAILYGAWTIWKTEW